MWVGGGCIPVCVCGWVGGACLCVCVVGAGAVCVHEWQCGCMCGGESESTLILQKP